MRRQVGDKFVEVVLVFQSPFKLIKHGKTVLDSLITGLTSLIVVFEMVNWTLLVDCDPTWMAWAG